MEYVTREGENVPAIGLGTWQMDEETAERAVRAGLEEGYRHVDTAQLYGNEGAVGRAIEQSSVDRDDVFLTTKVNPTHRSVDAIVESVRESVDRLRVDGVDLLLIHWPHPLATLETVMAGLNAAREAGLTRHIGVSNFGKDRLARAREHSDAPIFTDQVLFHPWWPQRELLQYVQSEGLTLTAYSPLANGGALGDPVLADVGERYGKSAAQVAIRWAIQHENVLTIPMSTSRAHLAENLDVFDFRLTGDEHERITRPSYLQTGWYFLRGQL